MRTSSMLLPGLLLAPVLAFGQGPRAAAPAPVQAVDDDAVRRALQVEYREPVALAAPWKARPGTAGADGERRVCALGPADAAGRRAVAVCTAYADAGHPDPGTVDLWLLAPKADVAGVVARLRDVGTGSMGNPGSVDLIAIGPGRQAFLLGSPYSGMGWTSDDLSLHVARDGTFVQVLALRGHVSNGGACDHEVDSAACRRAEVDLDCRIVPDVERPVRDGHFDLRVEVSGRRAGRAVRNSLRLPWRDGAYRPAPGELERRGCEVAY
ncbi:hypothetical protein [Lysobacter humi (ex Lee et al. 2017)]